MAELLGVVAGGAGLASLAIQLADGVMKFRGFYKASKNAPRSVDEMIFELETLFLLVRRIEQRQLSDQKDVEILARCIVACCLKIDRICDILHGLERQMSRSHSIGRIYSVFKEPDVKKLLDELDRARGLLALAYMDYSQSQTRHENAISSASALVREALLQQQLADLRTDVRSGNTVVTQQLSLLIQSGFTVSAHRGTQSQDDTVVRQMPQTTSRSITNTWTLGKQARRKQQWQTRLRLPSWLTTRVWDIVAAYESNGTLGFRILPVRIRPFHAPEFQYVFEGDLAKVRALLQRGELSLWDNRDGYENLLSMAVESGSVELCRMLLESASHLREINSSIYALRSLICSVFLKHGDVSYFETMCRLLVNECEMDFDLSGGPISGFIMSYYRDLPGTCSEILENAQTVPLEFQPFELRFTVLMKTSSCPPSVFLRQLSRDTPPQRVVSQRDDRGSTALHWMMRKWRRSCGDAHTLELNGYTESVDFDGLIFRLLQMGADPAALDFEGQTPLSGLLQWESWWQDVKKLKDIVEMYGSAIQNAGRSLASYVAIENAISRPTLWRLDENPDRYYSIDRFTVSGDPPRLSFTYRMVISLTLRTLASPPGSYPKHSYLPQQIYWHTNRAERTELFCKEGKEVRLYFDADSTYPKRHDSWEDLVLEAHEEHFSATQDDHGLIATMVSETDRLSRSTHYRRRRASSLPSQIRVPGVTGLLRKRQHAWLPVLHKCPGQSSWMPPHIDDYLYTDAFVQARACANSVLGEWTDVRRLSMWKFHSWESQLLDDKARRDVAERFMDRFWSFSKSDIREGWEDSRRREEMDRTLDEYIKDRQAPPGSAQVLQ